MGTIQYGKDRQKVMGVKYSVAQSGTQVWLWGNINTNQYWPAQIWYSTSAPTQSPTHIPTTSPLSGPTMIPSSQPPTKSSTPTVVPESLDFVAIESQLVTKNGKRWCITLRKGFTHDGNVILLRQCDSLDDTQAWG